MYGGLKDSAGNRTYRKLTKPKFINHKMYDPNNPEEREDYFYALLLLFVPFRDESSLLNEDETAEEAFERLLPDDDDASTYHSRLQAMLKARNTLKEINQARELDPIEKNEDNEDPEVYGEAKSTMQDLVDINTSGSNDFSLKEREEMLNADQSRIYHKVRTHMLHQKQHEDGECECALDPLRMFISGVGDTGKSFLIDAIKAMVK